MTETDPCTVLACPGATPESSVSLSFPKQGTHRLEGFGFLLNLWSPKDYTSGLGLLGRGLRKSFACVPLHLGSLLCFQSSRCPHTRDSGVPWGIDNGGFFIFVTAVSSLDWTAGLTWGPLRTLSWDFRGTWVQEASGPT